MDQETAEWLAGVLESRRGPTRTALGLADEIVREAQNIDEALLSWMRTNSRKGPRRGLEMMSFKALTGVPQAQAGLPYSGERSGAGSAVPSRIARPRLPSLRSLTWPEPKRGAGAVPPGAT